VTGACKVTGLSLRDPSDSVVTDLDLLHPEAADEIKFPPSPIRVPLPGEEDGIGQMGKGCVLHKGVEIGTRRDEHVVDEVPVWVPMDLKQDECFHGFPMKLKTGTVCPPIFFDPTMCSVGAKLPRRARFSLSPSSREGTSRPDSLFRAVARAIFFARFLARFSGLLAFAAFFLLNVSHGSLTRPSPGF